MRVKRQLKGLDSVAVAGQKEPKFLPVRVCLCVYYRGIWSKCKMLRDKHKVHQYYTINGLICL